MAHIRCDFKSKVLGMNTSMTVILPEDVRMQDVSVVYLLHGLEDNCSGWTRYTLVELYAREYNVAVVIPEVQRSFYTDMKNGLDYFTFINKELREVCTHFFNFSKKRERNYIMGLSMGGYGAIKCALTNPEKVNGCAAFSSVSDIVSVFKQCKDGSRKEFDAIFGPSVSNKDNLFYLLDRCRKKLPSFYIACGEEDERLFHSREISSALKEKGADVLFETWHGEHNWRFWNEAVERAFSYFFKEMN